MPASTPIYESNAMQSMYMLEKKDEKPQKGLFKKTLNLLINFKTKT